MSEINTNLILDGITLALRAEYTNARIESDKIEQGLTPPAFIVLLVTSEQQQRVGEWYKRMPLFDILYFPAEGREECYTVADNLCLALAVLTLSNGDKVRGTGMKFEIVDDVLHFSLSYNHFGRRFTPEDKMEDLEIEQVGGN